jgi:hypothetical protein
MASVASSFWSNVFDKNVTTWLSIAKRPTVNAPRSCLVFPTIPETGNEKNVSILQKLAIFVATPYRWPRPRRIPFLLFPLLLQAAIKAVLENFTSDINDGRPFPLRQFHSANAVSPPISLNGSIDSWIGGVIFRVRHLEPDFNGPFTIS